MFEIIQDRRALEARLKAIHEELGGGSTDPRQRDDLFHEKSLIEERIAALPAQ